jgi:antitoxin CptB
MNGDSTCSPHDLQRLRWQCRRGLLELDLLFVRFLEERYPELNSAQQGDFRRLLEFPDPMLLAWMQGQEQPPEYLKNIVSNITYHYEN